MRIEVFAASQRGWDCLMFTGRGSHLLRAPVDFPSDRVTTQCYAAVCNLVFNRLDDLDLDGNEHWAGLWSVKGLDA